MTSRSNEAFNEEIIIENCRSVAGKELPSVPKGSQNCDCGTILLMYQYKEPVWTKQEHKKVLKKIIELGQKHRIAGRGRVAPEGVNFTLSGMPQDVRDFCYSLRAWDQLFHETDFKLTDWIPRNKLFKSLSIRKTEELVAYGLAGDKAPSLQKFAGTHLEADEYHKAMMETDTVIVDVRNAYESSIGGFRPPEGGAELIDPKMRNSIEFPKWLNDPETQERLNGKNVLMYCTGGIRCERATALLNQMAAANPNLKPKGVYHMRGGVERYVKSFPQGGFWKGKNYLFDRRMEQVPGTKDPQVVEEEVESKCCLCRERWTYYRGKFKCSQSLCGVPVIVCKSCDEIGMLHPEKLTCELCKQGYKAPEGLPDLAAMKRKAESLFACDDGDEMTKKPKLDDSTKTTDPRRLFISKLPLVISKTKVDDALGGDKVKLVHWLTDRRSGGFYGSCIVEMKSRKCTTEILEKIKIGGIKIDKKKIKIAQVWTHEGEVWPPDGHVEREFPPIGH